MTTDGPGCGWMVFFAALTAVAAAVAILTRNAAWGLVTFVGVLALVYAVAAVLATINGRRNRR